MPISPPTDSSALTEKSPPAIAVATSCIWEIGFVMCLVKKYIGINAIRLATSMLKNNTGTRPLNVSLISLAGIVSATTATIVPSL